MRRALAWLLLWLVPLAVAAAEVPRGLASGIARLESGWAHVNYEVADKSAQAQGFDGLIVEAGALARSFPERAEPLVWTGVLQTAKAGAVGGMAGFQLVKAARQSLDAAERIDPRAAGGLGLSQLGTLYYQVPGFPLAFGNRGTARKYLERALAVDPDSLAANLAYGDYLVEGGNYPKAQAVLTHALAAPPRRDQPLADKGRRGEAEVLLAKVRSRLR